MAFLYVDQFVWTVGFSGEEKCDESVEVEFVAGGVAVVVELLGFRGEHYNRVEGWNWRIWGLINRSLKMEQAVKINKGGCLGSRGFNF